MSDSDKNAPVFAVPQSSSNKSEYAPTRRRNKWILDIPCLLRVIFFFYYTGVGYWKLNFKHVDSIKNQNN